MPPALINGRSSANRTQYVGPAIDNVFAQAYEPIELVVVDDGSTHDTREVLSAYADRLLALADNHSVTQLHRNTPVPVKYDWRAGSGSSGG
jgi:GT2 family glycosyltransferase